MVDVQKVSVTNVSDGPRLFNSNPPVIIPRGGASDGQLEISAAELKSMRATGYFDINGGSGEGAAEPGPLDGNVDELTAHLATIDNVDDVQSLIDAETAGKSRKSALAALEARRDELLGA
jgi:hypothetical protein